MSNDKLIEIAYFKGIDEDEIKETDKDSLALKTMIRCVKDLPDNSYVGIYRQYNGYVPSVSCGLAIAAEQPSLALYNAGTTCTLEIFKGDQQGNSLRQREVVKFIHEPTHTIHDLSHSPESVFKQTEDFLTAKMTDQFLSVPFQLYVTGQIRNQWEHNHHSKTIMDRVQKAYGQVRSIPGGYLLKQKDEAFYEFLACKQMYEMIGSAVPDYSFNIGTLMSQVGNVKGAYKTWNDGTENGAKLLELSFTDLFSEPVKMAVIGQCLNASERLYNLLKNANCPEEKISHLKMQEQVSVESKTTSVPKGI